MDNQSRAIDVIKTYNAFTAGRIEDYELLSKVCEYFDHVKNQNLTDGDKRFLSHISSIVGVPHYYDMLQKFNKEFNSEIDEHNIDLQVISDLLLESSLFTDENAKLHKYQKEVLNLFIVGELNRYFLSASTSFGKTHLVYEVIRKKKYGNIVLIFPTIALLSENLDRIRKNGINKINDYQVQTLSDVEENTSQNNIYIFTPERFLSFIDKVDSSFKIDFLFVDEIYKIDKGLIIDGDAKENERDVSYRLAMFQALTRFPGSDVLLVGPYINLYKKQSKKYKPSFDNFLKEYGIEKIDRNKYEIVRIKKADVEKEKAIYNFDEIDFDFTGKKNKKDKVQEVCDKVIARNENIIVYCNTKSNAEKVALEYETSVKSTAKFKDFLLHLKGYYNQEWIVIESLEKGVGVHHGLVPKYIQKEIIELFNTGSLNMLTATTTITEGVNTTAKNLLVYKSLKGHGKGSELVSFDAKNIAGRAGRFMEHYTGRVLTLDAKFIEKLEEEGAMISHKNFDLDAAKTEIDDEMTPNDYQDDRAKERIRQIRKLQEERGIPDDVFNQYKVVKKRDKILIYDAIKALDRNNRNKLDKFVQGIQSSSIFIDKDGFQIFLGIIFPIIEYEKLKFLIEKLYIDRNNNQEYSILFVALSQYLMNGFEGAYKYSLGRKIKKGEKNAINNAMREAADLIYNTFKYQLVKYLGVFNLMYRFVESQSKNINYNDVRGIERLITKLEYNSFSEEGRIANDYGVPYKIVEYYDTASKLGKTRIQNSFDSYEAAVFKKVDSVVNPK